VRYAEPTVAAGGTVTDAAQKLGVSGPTLYEWRKGRPARRPRPKPTVKSARPWCRCASASVPLKPQERGCSRWRWCRQAAGESKGSAWRARDVDWRCANQQLAATISLCRGESRERPLQHRGAKAPRYSSRGPCKQKGPAGWQGLQFSSPFGAACERVRGSAQRAQPESPCDSRYFPARPAE